MRPNRLKQLWRNGKPIRTCWLSTGDPLTAELLGHEGFDAVVIDMQHGCAIGPERMVHCLRAISTTDAVPLVRVPWNDPVHLQYALDAGAYGVIVPLVNTVEDAQRAAGACRYPPVGYRSAGPNRVALGPGADYLERANEEILCLVMIEHINAVARVDDIAEVPGIDGFFIGPGDLAISLGLSARSYTDEAHVAACRRIRESATAHDLIAGIASANAEDALIRRNEGFNFLQLGSEWGYIAQGSRAALQTFKA